MAANLPSLPSLVTPGDPGDELGAFIRHLASAPSSLWASPPGPRPPDQRGREIKREHIQGWQIAQPDPGPWERAA